MRMEPPVSLPIATGTSPAATATAEPEEEPPGTRSGAAGFTGVFVAAETKRRIGEFGHVEAADEHGAPLVQPFRWGGVGPFGSNGNVPMEAGPVLLPFHADVVLQANGHAVEGTQVPALRPEAVCSPGL